MLTPKPLLTALCLHTNTATSTRIVTNWTELRRTKRVYSDGGPMCCLSDGWSRLTLITLLCVIREIAGKDCSALSDNGPVVKLGSSLKVSCIFYKDIKKGCKPSIHVDKKEIYDSQEYNSTLFVNITKITENRTYTCKCVCCSEPCGLDIVAGYPPDIPQNLSCIQNGEVGNVTCTWKIGRETYIGTTSNLWVNTESQDSTVRPVPFPGSDSATFPVFGLQSHYSVWVNASNKLGFVVSAALNFTLSEIVKPLPPNILQVTCSSQQCVGHWDNDQNSQLLQLQHRQYQGDWIVNSFSANKRVWTVFDLEPFTEYEFQARCKLSPERGLWSEWSNAVSKRTDEEVPLRKVDVWYTEEPLSSYEKSLIVIWKELNKSEARGRILEYTLKVQHLPEQTITEYSIVGGNLSCRITCLYCNVTLIAFNSKGPSPPAQMTISQEKALPPQNVRCRPLSNHSIAISWQRPATTKAVNGYVVEWLPADLHKKEIRWRRTGPEELYTVITENIQPCECYQGAVHALYEHSVGRADFMDAYSWQSAPTQGLTPFVKMVSNAITVSWRSISREHRGGCLKSYKIFLVKKGDGVKQYGPIGTSVNEYIIRDLQSGEYRLCMSGRTAAGEGPQGQNCAVFVIQQQNDQQVPFMVTVGGSICLVCLVLICMYHSVSIRQRVSTCCFCFMPDFVPDPANSKWAKECSTNKGQMILEYDLNVNKEEPSGLEIQEFEFTWTIENPEFHSSSPLQQDNCQPQSGWDLSPEQTEYRGQLKCTYLKNSSQESDPLNQTQHSGDTDTTIDYISSHGLLTVGSEEFEEMCLDMLNFFPCPNSPFMEPMVSSGGKLTLDTVKVDCCEFLDLT